MRKFVSFEDTIAHTISRKDLESVDCTHNRKFNDIPGYVIRNNRIYKLNNYKWNKEDWSNYNFWFKKFTQMGKLEMRKFLIMAAWNQAKVSPPPVGTLL